MTNVLFPSKQFLLFDSIMPDRTGITYIHRFTVCYKMREIRTYHGKMFATTKLHSAYDTDCLNAQNYSLPWISEIQYETQYYWSIYALQMHSVITERNDLWSVLGYACLSQARFSNFILSLVSPATSSLPGGSVVGLSNSITVYAGFCSSFTFSLVLNCGFRHCVSTLWPVRPLSSTLSPSLASNLARLPGEGGGGGKRQ